MLYVQTNSAVIHRECKAVRTCSLWRRACWHVACIWSSPVPVLPVLLLWLVLAPPREPASPSSCVESYCLLVPLSSLQGMYSTHMQT